VLFFEIEVLVLKLAGVEESAVVVAFGVVAVVVIQFVVVFGGAIQAVVD
jgi:hypothetical protein